VHVNYSIWGWVGASNNDPAQGLHTLKSGWLKYRVGQKTGPRTHNHNSEYWEKVQTRTWLFPALSPSVAVCWPSAQVHDTITCLLVSLPNIHRIFKKNTLGLSNKPFLMCLFTTPPQLKCVATLPCNLSLMARFADINDSQGSVATFAMCGGIF